MSMDVGVPPADVPVPWQVRALAEGSPIVPVWGNELGGLTFRLGDARYVKWAPAGYPLDLEAEAARMRWAGAFLRVPRVLSLDSDGEGTWMVTEALPGENAVVPRWQAEPAVAVCALATGLRHLHDTLPVSDCPFSWAVEDRLGRMTVDVPVEEWARAYPELDRDDSLALLAGPPPPVDELVVCHGDSCAPNTVLTDDGRVSGHVDLGALGVADRWADIAIATWSLGWNYGPGWEDLFLETYGAEADPERTRYYRVLWSVT